MRRLFGLCSFLTLFFGSQLLFAQTEPEVTQMVEKAVKLLNAKGDEGLKEINKKNGDFHKGELYTLVFDENVTLLANPEKSELVGKNLKGKPDIHGKQFRDEIVQKGLNGGGWTEYDYQKPGSTGIFKKKVLCKMATHGGKKYIVGVGMYSTK